MRVSTNNVNPNMDVKSTNNESFMYKMMNRVTFVVGFPIYLLQVILGKLGFFKKSEVNRPVQSQKELFKAKPQGNVLVKEKLLVAGEASRVIEEIAKDKRKFNTKSPLFNEFKAIVEKGACLGVDPGILVNWINEVSGTLEGQKKGLFSQAKDKEFLNAITTSSPAKEVHEDDSNAYGVIQDVGAVHRILYCQKMAQKVIEACTNKDGDIVLDDACMSKSRTLKGCPYKTVDEVIDACQNDKDYYVSDSKFDKHKYTSYANDAYTADGSYPTSQKLTDLVDILRKAKRVDVVDTEQNTVIEA